MVFMWTHGLVGVLCSHDRALGKKALGIFLSYTPATPVLSEFLQ